jgi:hypothetical protein
VVNNTGVAPRHDYARYIPPLVVNNVVYNVVYNSRHSFQPVTPISILPRYSMRPAHHKAALDLSRR